LAFGVANHYAEAVPISFFHVKQWVMEIQSRADVLGRQALPGRDCLKGPFGVPIHGSRERGA